MESSKTQLQDMGFTDEQITNAINSTNSTDIEVLITYIESQTSDNPQPQQQQAAAQQFDSITKYVSEEHVAILMSEGHSKNVAEKSLLLSQNQGVEAAKQWIEEHKNDQDFEEELQIVGNGKKISPEEAAFKARELQQKLREKRRIAEEQAAFEQEKNRIASGKAMNDVRRELDEQKKKLEAQKAKREREQFLKDKQEMEEQLRREKEARFGKSYAQPSQQQQQQKKYSPIELFELGIKQIKVAYPPDLIPDTAYNSLTLIQKILENILKNPQEEKFRKISLTSQAYLTKIEQVLGARNALDGLGFEENNGFYVFQSADVSNLQKAISIVQTELK
ncbi:unnamed protein product (macronuclear) [Paramecium tetraurelia]|uniref:UBA domain-containing protein n=1 Tax=Paramecium tetraurelia TaxID=5888 RepID=A0BQP9_PARTE|nr:uncharacterized protein GSPATT00031095001 [Paramecium tetraurelia]CAK60866.1 unnamed protein product [Paramecium tetraurelia]|eukprot:XP_001428264.1 hypothetical protein (macronuclear) [Paramecium tetraurelia strain d4-2]